MKQRIFSSKGLFGNTLYRSSWLGLVNGILFFFALPVAMLFILQDPFLPDDRATRAAEVFIPGEGGYGIWMLLAMMMGAVTAWAMSIYLHDRRQVIFFHSQPVSRRGLYLTRLSSGLIWFAAALLTNLLLTAVVFAAFGTGVPWGRMAALFGLMLLGFFFLFSATAFCAPLAGSALSHIEVTAFALFAPVGLAGSGLLLCGRFFSTFVVQPWLKPLLRLCGPAWMLSLPIEGESLWRLAVYAVAAAVLLALGVTLVGKYPSEAAGTTLTYPFTRTVIRLPAVFMGTVFMGAFFYIISNSPLLEGLGCLLGGILVHMYCQGRFFRDFRAVFRGWISLAALLIVSGALMVCMGLDVFGYDHWLPENDAVASTGVFVWSENYSYDGPEDLINEGEEWVTVSRGLAESGLTVVDQLDADFYFSSVRILWKMKDGRTVSRQYQLPRTSENLEMLCRLQNSPAYRAAYGADTLAEALGNAAYVGLWAEDRLNMDSAKENYVHDPETVARLLGALSEDYLEKGVSPGVGTRVTVQVNIEAGDGWKSSAFPVYADWSRSLRVLEEEGLWAPPGEESIYRFYGLRIYKPDGDAFTVTEPEEMLEALACLQWQGEFTDTENRELFLPCALLSSAEERSEGSFYITEKYPGEILFPGTDTVNLMYLPLEEYNRLYGE